MPFDGNGFKSDRAIQIEKDIAVLRVACDGVSHPGKWIRGKMTSFDGQAHCAVGWVRAATAGSDTTAIRLIHDYIVPDPAIQSLLPGHPNCCPADRLALANDTLGQGFVIALFNRAMQRAERMLNEELVA